MAMIPTMTARTPSRISEVDDDLSTDAGLCVDVDVDMAGVPFVRLGFLLFGLGAWPLLSVSGCGRNGHRRSRLSQYSWTGPRAEGRERISGQSVTQASK